MEDNVEAPPPKRSNVLDDHPSGVKLANQSDEVEPEAGPCAGESCTLAGEADVLAGEATAEEVDLG